MREVNQHHYLLSSPTIDRMISSTAEPTPMTPTGLGNPPQKQPYRQPSLKDKMDRLQQGRDCNSSTRQEEIYSCKSLSPLEAIKGEPGLVTRFRFTHAQPPYSFTEQQPALCPPQSRDLGLSSSRNLLVLPTTSTFGCKAIQTPDLTRRRAFQARTSINPLCLTCITIQAWVVTQTYTRLCLDHESRRRQLARQVGAFCVTFTCPYGEGLDGRQISPTPPRHHHDVWESGVHVPRFRLRHDPPPAT